MKAFKRLWIAVLFAPQLLGQMPSPSSIPHPTNEEIRETNEAMASIWNYCLNVADYSSSRQPRLFAKTESNETGAWDEFSSKAEWEQAGKPQPVAFAWYKENKVVRAVFLSKNNGDGGRYAEYCFRADGHLAELQSGADVSAVCDDAYFRCQLTLPREWLYLPTGKIVNVIHDDQRPLKSEKTNLSLSTKPPEYLTIWDLPFAASLFVHAK
jgi:hypothetical protein